MLRMLAFSLRWRGEREPGQLWSISLVELLNYKLHSQNHAHYQRGGSPSTVKKVRQTLRTGNVTASKWRSLQNSSSSKSFEHYEIEPIFKWAYSGHILSWIYFKYTNHFNFTCYPIYFASTRRFKHFRISDMALLCDFMH
jgi:hypothetical protein